MKTSLATLCLATVALIPLRADETQFSNLTANCSALALDLMHHQTAEDDEAGAGVTQTVIDVVAYLDQDQPSAYSLFSEAQQAKKAAQQDEIKILSNAAKIEARLDLALEKSLVEREEDRLDADSALPEDSPTPVPFTSSRPDFVVSAGHAYPGKLTDGDPGFDCKTGLVCTPEPSTWALFGCGAFLLVCTLPKRAKAAIKSR